MKTTLIVDDDPIFLELMQAFFKKRGNESLMACDGNQAKELLVKNLPEIELVVCDLEMPHCDGEEFFGYLNIIAPRANLIVVSGAPPAIVNSATRMAYMYNLNLLGTFHKPLDFVRFEELLLEHDMYASSSHRLSGALSS